MSFIPSVSSRLVIAMLGCMALVCAAAAPTIVRAGEAELFPPLRQTRDADLQLHLEQVLARLKLSSAVAKKRLAVTIVDMADGDVPRMASVNGDYMMYSASLPKIAILLGAFSRVEEGSMVMTSILRTDLVAMIRNSSNVAATRVLEAVGRDYILQVLRSDKYGLYNRERGGGLWVGKPYGPEPAYRRDPLKGLSHGATSIQAARFYYLLEAGRLVSPAASAEMKKILGKPAIKHKFVKGLTRSDADVKIYRKSGTWRNFHSDSAIVEHQGKHYIIVALTDDARGGSWLADLAESVDGIMSSSL